MVLVEVVAPTLMVMVREWGIVGGVRSLDIELGGMETSSLRTELTGSGSRGNQIVSISSVALWSIALGGDG